MKKILSLLVVCLLLLSSVAVGGCYRIEAADKSKIAGTYELVRYSRSSTEEDREGNFKAQLEITSYLVVAEDGTGYYAYKDKDTDPYIIEVSISFIESEEQPGKYEYVEMQSEIKPLAKKMGYRRGYLNIGVMDFAVRPLKYQGMLYTDYKKVDKAQDLTYVRKQMPDVPLYKRGEVTYRGYFLSDYVDCEGLTYEDCDAYVYYLMKLDPVGKKAYAYYMLKSEREKREEVFDYSVATGTGEYGEVFKLTINGKTTDSYPVTSNSAGFYIPGSLTIADQVRDVKIHFYKYSQITDEHRDDIIDDMIRNYNNSIEDSAVE